MSDTPITVRVDDVHVTFKVYEDRPAGIKDMLQRSRRKPRLVHAVRGVSFDLYEGESLGIVGSNGSGKSTLLSALTGLLPVDSGEIWIRSRPTLLGVGAVMRPSLSGRRNIIIGGLALGLTLDEITDSMESVIDFADIHDAIDLPMRTYSSGMRARLMFSIATSTIPEVLLIDEALAVGDSAFFRRSRDRIDAIRASAGSVVIVSHNLGELRSTCDRVIWMDQGRVVAEGDPDEVIGRYEGGISHVGSATGGTTAKPKSRTTRHAASPQRLDRRAVLHVGTAMTAAPIQRFLAVEEDSLKRQGVRSPTFLGRRSHYAFAAYANEQVAEVLAIDPGPDWAAWRATFRSEVLDAMDDDADWVVSSEEFGTRLGSRGLDEIITLLRDAGFARVEIVAYVQRQDRLAARMHLQSLDQGHLNPFDIDEDLEHSGRYDTALALQRMQATSADDVLIRLFPDRPNMTPLVHDFCDTIGVDRPVEAEWGTDRLLNVPAAEFVRQLNAALPRRDQDGNLIPGIANPAEVLKSGFTEESFQLATKESDALMARYRESNEWVMAQVPEELRVEDYFDPRPAPENRPPLTVADAVEMTASLWRRSAKG